ncbi:MAG: hypothetical protein ACLTQI_08035 [Slackia sp.]
MEGVDFSRLDVALAIYDANDDPREADLYAALRCRRTILKHFQDPCDLVERKYGGMRFSRLLDEDQGDEAMKSACIRWRSTSASVIEEAGRVLPRRIGAKAEAFLLAKHLRILLTPQKA